MTITHTNRMSLNCRYISVCLHLCTKIITESHSTMKSSSPSSVEHENPIIAADGPKALPKLHPQKRGGNEQHNGLRRTPTPCILHFLCSPTRCCWMRNKTFLRSLVPHKYIYIVYIIHWDISPSQYSLCLLGKCAEKWNLFNHLYPHASDAV